MSICLKIFLMSIIFITSASIAISDDEKKKCTILPYGVLGIMYAQRGQTGYLLSLMNTKSSPWLLENNDQTNRFYFAENMQSTCDSMTISFISPDNIRLTFHAYSTSDPRHGEFAATELLVSLNKNGHQNNLHFKQIRQKGFNDWIKQEQAKLNELATTYCKLFISNERTNASKITLESCLDEIFEL